MHNRNVTGFCLELETTLHRSKSVVSVVGHMLDRRHSLDLGSAFGDRLPHDRYQENSLHCLFPGSENATAVAPELFDFPFLLGNLVISSLQFAIEIHHIALELLDGFVTDLDG